MQEFLMLQGEMTVSDGKIYRTSVSISQRVGSQHRFTVLTLADPLVAGYGKTSPLERNQSERQP
ncbi:hypothetical protein [Sedimentitalea nanhaiensis]|uniref:Uncharacterized protein n=1 Tax=Sedimentitalea nanhaiensis TaxID=999627 RepID=A0A1I7C3M3_9RHOB|nr:hypothetical protein [Sedimentitalea nanhaiensis]SFT94009.1 hypothetical protein SAMN05216236_11424 [Sedimentitalea nanhaiensis]